MTDHHNEHQENDEQNHDDCEDCKRERAQNQKFIAIYQKLQDIDKKTFDMKNSLTSHQQNFQKSKGLLKSFDSKVQRIKSNKNEKQESQFQQIGYNLYAQILENHKKTQTYKQNERLKLMLKNIYQERDKKINLQSKELEKSLIFPQISQSTPFEWFEKNKNSLRVESRKSQVFDETSMGKSFEISSTKSSFHMTKRKIFQKKDFQELNLWLFEDKHQLLEKQLYQKDDQQIKSSLTQNHNQQRKGIQQYIIMAKNVKRQSNLSSRMSTSLKSQNPNIQLPHNPSFRYNQNRISNENSNEKSMNKNLNNTNNNLSNQTNNSLYRTKETKEKNPTSYKSKILYNNDAFENNSNSSKFFEKRIRRVSILPTISNKI